MANSTISGLPSGLPALGTDLIPIARSGANYNLTLSSLLAQSGSSFNVNSSTGAVTVGPPSSGIALTVNGTVSIPDGTSSTFRVIQNGVINSFGSDASGGVIASDVGALNFKTNGTPRFSIGANGNVTFNNNITTLSNSAVVINFAGAGHNGSLGLQISDGTTTSVYGYVSGTTHYVGAFSDHTFGFLTHNQSRMTISNKGAVVIGTPESGIALSVNAAAVGTIASYIAGAASGSANIGLQSNAGSGTLSWITANTAGSLLIGGTGGIEPTAAPLSILSAGNVNIGPPTSGIALTVTTAGGTSSGLAIVGQSGQSGANISTTTPTGTTNYWRIGQIGVIDWDIKNAVTTGEFQIVTGAATPFAITPNGNTKLAPTSGTALTLTGVSTANVINITTAAGANPIQISDGTCTSWWFSNGTNGIGFGTQTNHNVTFYVNNAVRIQASSGGTAFTGVTATSAAAPTIASATTIAPTTAIVFVSGTTAIATITAPSPISAGGGHITLIPTGIFTTTTAGNIGLASTAVVGKALIMTYDTTTTKWYPSY